MPSLSCPVLVPTRLRSCDNLFHVGEGGHNWIKKASMNFFGYYVGWWMARPFSRIRMKQETRARWCHLPLPGTALHERAEGPTWCSHSLPAQLGNQQNPPMVCVINRFRYLMGRIIATWLLTGIIVSVTNVVWKWANHRSTLLHAVKVCKYSHPTKPTPNSFVNAFAHTGEN